LTDSFRRGSLATIEIAVLTSFMRDHQDYYHSMEAYRRDKELLFELQDEHGWKIIDPDEEFAHHFLERGPGRVFPVGGARPGGADLGGRMRALLDGARGILVDEAGERHDVFPEELPVPGEHNRRNLLFAAATAYLVGAQPDAVASGLANFGGVRHRMEVVRTVGTCRFVNDSAATVPEAALAAVRSFDAPVYLIAGGTDKNLEFPLFRDIAEAAKCYLLSGSATDRIIDVLAAAGLPFEGPFQSLQEAVRAAARQAAREKGPAVVLLSPGCASFGMFRNEFDRGDQFRAVVTDIT
jgi:UDP-N-acetylmuramoylalanine--D-glutamate ligase